ncbi:MAG TPA: J domain-containing protein [Coleofasciculaceae cyanobacterium]
MQNFRNYYAILGVARDASVEEIKRSFRRLARQYHPDLNPGDKQAEDKFKDLNEAYEVLSDSSKRSQYDQFGKFWRQQGFQGGSGTRPGRVWNGRDRGTASDMDFSEFPDFNSFVDQLLNRRTVSETPVGSGGGREYYRPGTSKTSYTVPRATRRDAEARLTVPLEKAYTGGRERIRLEDGRSLEVNMPAGMVSGQRVRLKGQGVAGGDLYLKIDVATHPFFQLDGIDILCQLPITPSEAVLGGAIEVPTLDGLVKMSIPTGVKSGQRLRLANKGYPGVGGQRGDQIVDIQIVVPKEISPEEQELYEKLRQVETFNPRADLPV